MHVPEGNVPATFTYMSYFSEENMVDICDYMYTYEITGITHVTKRTIQII